MKMSKLLKSVSEIVMLFMAIILIVSVVNFLLPFNIEVAIAPVSLVIAVCVYWLIQKKSMTLKDIVIPLLIILAVIVAGCIISCLIYSNDGDGNYYHKVGVGALAKGWNPFAESVQDFASRYFNTTGVDYNAIWVDHYGKASWMIAAAFYGITGNIECGKIYNILGMVVLLGQVFQFLEKCGLKKIYVYIFSLLIVFNPIVNVQVFTYYVDGFLFTLIIALMISLIEFVRDKSYSNATYLFIAANMTVLGNVKFTGLMYGGILCVIYFVYYAIIKYKEEKRVAYKECGFFAAVAAITCIVAGAPTYMQNMIEHGNPFYPLMGEGKVDIMGLNSPGGFLDHSIVYKLFYSIFGQVDNFSIMMGGDKLLPDLKIPFTTSIEELMRFKDIVPDSRISGMGIFFSGLLICSTVIGVYYVVKNRRYLKSVMPLIIINVAYTALMMLVISESWWARYVPFLYIFMIAGFVLMARFMEGIFPRIILVLMLIILVCNNVLFFANIRNFYNGSQNIRRTIDSIRDKEIEVTRVDYPGSLFILVDEGIDAKINISDGEEEGLYYDYLGYRVK